MTDGTVRVAESDAKWNAENHATDDELRARFVNATGDTPVFDPWNVSSTTRVHEVYGG